MIRKIVRNAILRFLLPCGIILSDASQAQDSNSLSANSPDEDTVSDS